LLKNLLRHFLDFIIYFSYYHKAFLLITTDINGITKVTKVNPFKISITAETKVTFSAKYYAMKISPYLFTNAYFFIKRLEIIMASAQNARLENFEQNHFFQYKHF